MRRLWRGWRGRGKVLGRCCGAKELQDMEPQPRRRGRAGGRRARGGKGAGPQRWRREEKMRSYCENAEWMCGGERRSRNVKLWTGEEAR